MMGDGGDFKTRLAGMAMGTEGDFDGMALGDERVCAICRVLHPRVELLFANECGLGDAGAEVLAEQLAIAIKEGRAGAIRGIDLDSNQIGVSGASAIAGVISRCVALEGLGLSDNRLGDFGMMAIAEAVQHCPLLEYIDLDSNQITDSGVMALVASIPYCLKLSAVDLEDNPGISASAKAAVAAALEGPRRVTTDAPPPLHSTHDPIPGVSAKLAAAQIVSPSSPTHPTKTTASAAGPVYAARPHPQMPVQHSSVPLPIPALSGDKETHVLISHAWGPPPDYPDHRYVLQFAEHLKAVGLKVWIDGERLSSNILGQITRGVERTEVFIACVTPTYMAKVQAGSEEGSANDWCEQEFTYAHEFLGKAKMLAVIISPASLDVKQWRGPVRFVLSATLLVDASTADKFPGAAREVAKRVAKLLP